jgi:UDP-N-acetylmuramoyl-tripeptide--D-alanyl-D-alanine ligase
VARPEGATQNLDGLSIDSRTLRPGQAFVAIKGERVDGHAYVAEAVRAGAGLLIVADAAVLAKLPKPVPALVVADTGQALLKLAGAYRKTLDVTRVIAVGGSNGKTTTVNLIHQVLSRSLRGTASPKSFNNAVGVPLTILNAKRGDQYLVCEVGTNAPGEILPLTRVIEPDIAVITSIGREHLEGLKSLQGVVQEEASLLNGLRPGGVAIVNADAPGLVEGVKPRIVGEKRQLLTFGFAETADLRITSTEQTAEGLRLCLNGRTWFSLPLLGLHNASNAAAAVAVGRRMGVAQEEIEAALAAASGPPMRLERVNARGVLFVNDAYNANPESVLAALRTFGEIFGGDKQHRRVVVLGDMLELGDQAPEMHREVGEALGRCAWADHVMLVGKLSLFTAERAMKTLPAGRVTLLDDVDGPGAAKAAGLLRDGDVVLLKGSRRMGLERIIDARKAGASELLGPEVKPVDTVGKPPVAKR